MKNNGAESGQTEQLHATPLAIIGIGCMFPQADNAGQFWTNIKNATDAISEVPQTHWRSEDYYDQDPKSADKVYAKLGGFLSPVTFNPMDYGILPNAIEAIDTSQLLGLLTVDQALKDAGYSSEREFDRDKVSVILGVTGALELVIPLGARLGYPRWKEALTDAGVDERLAEDVMQRISDSYVPWQENSFPGLLGNVVAGRISKHFNLGGTNCVVDAACGSSLSALNLAALELAAGRSDMVITGGVDTFNDIFMYTCFSKTPALSPTGHARPYDADSDGTTLGEGLGVVVIKRLADAERDGDKIYAVVRGIGASSDGRGAAIYEPDAKGQAKALKRAYEQAGVTPDSIELLEGHGTGTKVGDAIELSALHEVFGEAQQPWCALGSIKSQIGHTKAAAGAAGLIKAALALYHKTLPPTIKVTKPQDSLCSATTPFYVNSQTRPWIAKPDHPRRAGVSALGFGGSNFHCLLEEYQSAKAEVDWNEDVQLLPFSAASREELQRKLNAFPQDVTAKELRRLARQQRDSFDPSAEFRLVLSIENSVSAVKLLDKALTLLDKHQESDSWDTPDGIFFGHGQLQGRLAMLFPGQGAQYPGMLSDLALQFPEFLATVEDADRAVARNGGLAAGTLAKAIYPQPVFTEALRKEQAVQLQATEMAQPALGTVSLAGARVLARFGVVPEAVAGHSYGELTALCAAEVVTTDDLFVLSRLRGELMARGHGDRGSMLAVSAPLEQIEKFLEEEQLDLVLANRNTPTQGVLSGSTAAIEKARDLLTEKGLACKQLDVSAAFHSRLVADAAQPFAERLEQIPFNTPRKEVFSNTTGEAYPVTGDAVRELFAQQLASPVDFISEIENLYAAGVRIFLEVGPGGRLSGMVKAILPQDDVHVLALDSSSGRRSNIVDLAYVLGRLSALGASVALKHWDSDFILDEPEKTGKKPGIKVTLCGANHYQQPPKRKPLNIEPTPNSSVQQTLPAAAPRTVETMNKATTDQQDPPSRNILAALQITQQSLQALQDLQQQTAKLHQQFLEGQQTATQTFMTLVHQQQHLMQGNSIAPSGIQPVSFSPAQPQPVPAAMVERSAVPDSQITAAANSVPDNSTSDYQQPEPVGSSVDSAPLLLTIIAEKTGYPVEMLELDMALDSDLGIDSIKRVEILSALQEKLPQAPTIRPEDLGTLQTLGQIVAYLNSSVTSTDPIDCVPSSGVDKDKVATTLLEVIAEKTGYPVEMLELDMALDSDLGIDSIKRVEILSALQEKLPNVPAVRPEDLGVLQTLGQIIDHLSQGTRQRIPTIPSSPQPGLPDRDKVGTTLLEVIAEKTGYPVEMLELDMALDSDLGIDSIKRVEILSALQEKLPNVPAVRPEDLGVLQTLGQIIDHLSQGTRQRIPTVPPTPQLGQLDRDKVATTLLEVIAEKTGYPVEMLELDMALDSDLGIDSIKRVEILSALQERLPGAPAIKPEHLGTLQTVRQIVDFLASSPASQPATTVAQPTITSVPGTITRKLLKVTPLAQKRPTIDFQVSAGAEVWISDDGSALTDAVCDELTAKGLIPKKISLNDFEQIELTERLAGLVLLAPLKGTDDDFIKRAFQCVRHCVASLDKRARNQGAFLTTVSRLNGNFGIMANDQSKMDCLSGGLSGLCKTVALEWPSLHCKTLDLGMGMEILPTAKAVANEIFMRAPLEVGITSRGLNALELEQNPLEDAALKPPVAEGELVIVSGGARGVTAEAAVALAERSQATLLLLGRSPLPDREPEWLASAATEAQIKQAIVQHADQALKPKEVEKTYQRLCAQREIRSTLERILRSGGQALYHAVDLRDQQALTTLVDELRQQYGPVKGIIHGAGVLADKLLVEKTDEQFDQVYSTKVEGLKSLLGVVEKDLLSFIALFSSSTGRFGRIGQIDYAIANEILNKIAHQQAALRPECRVVSFNWGPWDGGMVTPALKTVFAREGIEVIDLHTGAEYFVDEISTPPSGPVEVVIMGGESRNNAVEDVAPPQNIYVSKAFDLDLSVEQYPFLGSHVIDGKAVLPMAVVIEWLAHGAMHNNPGLKFQGFNDLRILKGVTLEATETLELQVMTGKAIKSNGVHIIPVELSSGQASASPLVHARGRIILASKLPEAKQSPRVLDLPEYPLAKEEAYQSNRLFHGEMLQGIREMIGCSAEGISALVQAAPQPGRWIQQPLRSSWLSDPLALDSSFQLLILWSFEHYQSGSLPVFTERYRQYQEKFPESGVEIRVRVVDKQEHRAVANIDFINPLDGQLVAQIENYECVIDRSLNQSFQRNKLTGVA